MLAKVVNKWIYNGKVFTPNSLVEMPEELFNHLFETSIVERVTLTPAIKVHEALVNGVNISEAVKEKIGLVNAEQEFAFKIDYSDTVKYEEDGEEKETKELRTAFFRVSKDPELQTIK